MEEVPCKTLAGLLLQHLAAVVRTFCKKDDALLRNFSMKREKLSLEIRFFTNQSEIEWALPREVREGRRPDPHQDTPHQKELKSVILQQFFFHYKYVLSYLLARH